MFLPSGSFLSEAVRGQATLANSVFADSLHDDDDIAKATPPWLSPPANTRRRAPGSPRRRFSPHFQTEAIHIAPQSVVEHPSRKLSTSKSIQPSRSNSSLHSKDRSASPRGQGRASMLSPQISREWISSSRPKKLSSEVGTPSGRGRENKEGTLAAGGNKDLKSIGSRSAGGSKDLKSFGSRSAGGSKDLKSFGSRSAGGSKDLKSFGSRSAGGSKDLKSFGSRSAGTAGGKASPRPTSPGPSLAEQKTPAGGKDGKRRPARTKSALNSKAGPQKKHDQMQLTTFRGLYGSKLSISSAASDPESVLSPRNGGSVHARSDDEGSPTAEDASPLANSVQFRSFSASQTAQETYDQAWWLAQNEQERELEGRVLPVLSIPTPKVPAPKKRRESKSLRTSGLKQSDADTPDAKSGALLPWERSQAIAARDTLAHLEKRSRSEVPLVCDVFTPADEGMYLGMWDAYSHPECPETVQPRQAPADLFLPPLHEDLECGEFRPARDLRAEVDPTRCRVFGPGVEQAEAGRMATFTIQAVASDGTFIRCGTAVFTVYVEQIKPPAADRARERVKRLGDDDGPEEDYDSDAERRNQYLPPAQRSVHRRKKDTQDGHVFDSGDGTYTVDYCLTVATPHAIYIYLNDRIPVAGSPYQVNVAPGTTTADSCEAYGDGTQVFALGGGINEIMIQAKDAHGNDVTTGGEKFTVVGLGAAKIVETTDMHDGKYWVKYFVSQGAERNFVEISISYHGRPIKGSPFRPRPAGPVEDETPPERLFELVNVVNPTDSLIRLAATFERRWSKAANPPPICPYPRFPSVEEAEEILERAKLDYDADIVDTSGEHLRETTEMLLRYSKTLLGRDNTMQAVLKNLKVHGDVGSLHNLVEKANREQLNQYIDSVAKLQADMDVTYKSIQHGVADYLPVAFELDDPEEIRALHKERRQHLVEIHKALEKKEQELRARESRFKTERLKYVSAIATEIEQRREAARMEKAALKENTEYILRLTQLSLKKHLRREMLSACEREPVEAFKSRFWQRDFSRMLIETPALSKKKPDVAKMQTEKELEPVYETEQLPAVKPDDPTRPATWFHNGEFLSFTPTEFGVPKIVESARARGIRASRILAGGNATYVSSTSTCLMPPSSPPEPATPKARPAKPSPQRAPYARTKEQAEKKAGRELQVRFDDPRLPGFFPGDIPREVFIPGPGAPLPPPPARYL
ncbi:filamin repeat-containing protein [Besnoitia besnoiti]|uniref:Filamin repeat-containing protein n=1 Tax=Besnoitia besnoiti TaxID=94643 RepID=A0A2A9MFM7_BESBE|nr:filamin repeat-containing protein [Besnoitia besnoiti]PFH34776.1 filamin repeat-containing protein [Besnoitia besnoiti]